MTSKTLKKGKASDPTTQKRCIWMTAGVVAFKLCPYDYNCEQCEFDKVMQHKSKKSGPVPVKPDTERRTIATVPTGNAAPFFSFSIGKIPDDFYFHLGHLWARPLKKQTWKIGMDRLLSYILPPPIGIVTFKEKKAVAQGEILAEVRSDAGPIPLRSPLSGTLVSANPDLEGKPGLMQENPMGKGWLVKMKWSGNDAELKEFYTGAEAKRFMQEEACHLRHVLKYRGVEAADIGKTLPDGGADIKHLHQVLPAKYCFELSQVLITLGEKVW